MDAPQDKAESLSLSLLPAWVMGLKACACARLDGEGRILEANAGFLAAVGDALLARLRPDLGQLRASATGPGGLVYEGLLEIGGESEFTHAYVGRVWCTPEGFFVVAEVDIAAFETLSQELAASRKQADELKRLLNRRSHALHDALEELAQMKNLDTLTGLPNRAALDRRMEEEIRRWDRSRRPLALLLMDIDDFTRINEDYGREAGDEILGHIATLAKQAVRGVDLVARFGGQEFALLLPETNEMGALIVAERLRMELENQLILPVLEPITVSFGAATYLGGESRAEFYARAWRALKASKAHGKNCITLAGVVAECDHLYRGGRPPAPV